MTPRQQVIAYARRFGLNVDDVLEQWSERTAIREYDGEMTRDEAEREAAGDMEEMLCR